MKRSLFKLSLSLLLFIVASFSFAQTSDDVQFEKKVLKFKKVNEGEIVKLTYFFQNSSEIEISIIPPKVDCSCTEVILPEGKINSMAKDSIVIKFDTKDKIGYQEREVVVHFISDFMDSRSIEKKLVFKGVVKASQATKEAYKNSK